MCRWCGGGRGCWWRRLSVGTWPSLLRAGPGAVARWADAVRLPGYLGDVAAFDIASRRMLWRLEVSGVRADHVALSPDGSRLFVSALTANEVQLIDTRIHRFIGSFPTGDWAHVLEFTPDGRFIVNGSLGDQLMPNGALNRFWMTFADPRTLRVKRVFKFDAGVRPFTFSPDGRLAYVQFSYFNVFKVVSTSSGAIVHTVNLP